MAVERPLQLFSREKLAEFRGMTLEARLAWLEEANALIDLVHGPRRGAVTTHASAIFQTATACRRLRKRQVAIGRMLRSAASEAVRCGRSASDGK